MNDFFFNNSARSEAFSLCTYTRYECNVFFSNNQEGQKEAFSFYIDIHYECNVFFL